MQSVGASMVGVGKTMTRSLTLPIVGLGVVSTKMALDFEASMQQLRTSAGASQKEVDNMSKAVLAMAQTTAGGGQGPEQLAKGLYMVESSGLRGSAALKVLSASAIDAAVTGTDMTDVVNALTSAVKVQAKGTGTAAHAMGVLNAIVGAGKMHMVDLTGALKSGVLPVVKVLGISLPQLGAALDVFTLQGVPAEQAATKLRTVFLKMLAPTGAGAKALKEMGIGVTDLGAKLKSGGLTGALDLLRAKYIALTDKLGSVKANQLIVAAFGGSKTGATMLQLIQGFGQYNKSLAQVDKTTKDFAASAAKAMNTPVEKIKVAMSSLKASAVIFGAVLAPIFATLAGWLAKVGQAFGGLSPSMQKIVLIAAGAVAALGPLLTIFGHLAIVIGAIASPIGLVAAGLALLVGGFAAAILAPQKFQDMLQKLGLSATTAAAIVDGFRTVAQAVVSWVQANWPQISATFMAVFTTVKSIVQDAVSVITALWNQFGAQILAQLKATWTFVQSYLSGVLNVIRGIFNVFGGLLSGDWSRVWLGLQQIFTGIWQQMTAVIRLALSTIVNVLTAAGRLMLSAVQGPWNAIKALASTVFNGVVSAIRGAVGAAVAAARAIGVGVVHGIGDGLRTIVAVVKGGLDKIWGVISGVAKSAYGAAIAIGAAIMHGVAAGILGALGSALDAIKHAGSAIVGAAKGFLHIGSPSQLMADEVGRPIVEGIAAGILAGMPKAVTAIGEVVRRVNAFAIATMIANSPAFKAAAAIVGASAAEGIALGITVGKSKLQLALDALRQVVIDKKAAFVTAFDTMATDALAKFDAKFAGWKPPSLGRLAAMQLQDQIHQMTDSLGPAVYDAETALAAAFTSGNAAAIATAQANLNTALAAAQAQIAATQAQAVSDAQAALTAAQASGDPAAVQKAQSDLDAAVATQTATLAKAQADQRALVEQNLQYRADAEQRTHDAILAKQRAGLVTQLAELKKALLENPKAWDTAQAAILKLLGTYEGKMKTAGAALGNQFAAGIRSAIGEIRNAADAAAAAVRDAFPSSPSAKRGPLSDNIYEVGKDWAGYFARGVAAGGMGSLMGSMTGAPGGSMAAVRGASGGSTSGQPLTINVYGSVLTENDLIDVVRKGLYRTGARNAGLAFS